MDIRNSLLFTEHFDTPRDFAPPDDGAYYLYQWTGEERSAHARRFDSRERTFRLNAKDTYSFRYESRAQTGEVALRSSSQLSSFVRQFSEAIVYLDITGIEQKIWMPLLRAILQVECDLRVAYVEPASYAFNVAPTEGELFDLTDDDPDSGPIPGFATLAADDETSAFFVPLVGFEGTRFSFLIEQLQPSEGRILPLIGVPGFGPDYPIYSYLGNKQAFLTSESWKAVKYVPADCPFRTFYTLEEIALKHSDDILQIAPIGTKPHALAALLLKLFRPEQVVLVQDNRIHKPSGTNGVSKMLVYHVTELCKNRFASSGQDIHAS